MDAFAWGVIGSVAGVVGAAAAIVFGLIPLLRNRQEGKKAPPAAGGAEDGAAAAGGGDAPVAGEVPQEQVGDRLQESMTAAVAGRAMPSAFPRSPGEGSEVAGKPRFPGARQNGGRERDSYAVGAVPGSRVFRDLAEAEGAAPLTRTLMLSGEELRACLCKLDVPEADVPKITAWIEQCVARTIHPSPTWAFDRLGLPFSGASPLQERLARFLDDLLNFIQPERIFAGNVYLSRAKLKRYFRVYGQAMEEAGDWSEPGYREPAHRKFIVLYRHLSSRGLVVSVPILQLLDRPLPPDPDTVIYFTGKFTLLLDHEILDRFPELQDRIDGPEILRLDGMAYRIFGADERSFYPMVRFAGTFWGRETAILLSRKHLKVDSSTLPAFVDALRGRPMNVAGFGTVDESPELHALALRISLPTR
jgi:hypothetical protein